jgi:HD-like signal output (HDOD) protein
MNADLLRKILDEHQELSSLPQTLAEVLRVAKDEDSSAHDLAEVLRRDPSLTTRILRVVNSPFYGAGREIHSVTQAVVTMGIRAVTALALSTSIYDMTSKWEGAVDRRRFWRHSLSVAVAARMIAEEVKYPFGEEAFVTGLLHDLGLLILEKSFPQEFNHIWQQAKTENALIKLEQEMWATDHARVAQFLFEQWNLPRSICNAVGLHHQFDSHTSTDRQLVLIVALADTMTQFHLVESADMSTEKIDRKKALAAHLSLKQDRLKQIERDHLDRAMEEAKFLEIDIGSPDAILIEANRMLYHQYLIVENLLRENRRMQKQLVRAQMDKAALDTLKTITATFHHYINNAVATILGRAQLVEVALQKEEIVDHKEMIAMSMEVIINSVAAIQTVLEELPKLTSFKTTIYYDDTQIIDIEKKLQEKLQALEKTAPAPQ